MFNGFLAAARTRPKPGTRRGRQYAGMDAAAGRFGTLLQFVSGSKDHNVALRALAQKQGFSLSERCITTSDGREMLFSEEADIYRDSGTGLDSARLREDRGEIKQTSEHAIPDLLEVRTKPSNCTPILPGVTG